MRPIDADALIGDLHNHAFLEGDDRVIAYNIIQKQPTIGGWISVKDRLPGKYEPFYAACKSLTDDRENWVIEGIYKGMTYGGPWGVPMIEMGKAEVYAWMPKELPEPPKEGETKC